MMASANNGDHDLELNTKTFHVVEVRINVWRHENPKFPQCPTNKQYVDWNASRHYKSEPHQIKVPYKFKHALQRAGAKRK